MRNYAFYSKDTNEVLQVSMLPKSDLKYYNNPYIEFTLDRYNPIEFKYIVEADNIVELPRTDNFYLKQQYKQNRQILVNNIEVIYKGIIYQGDEISQDRINRAINSLPDNTTIKQWKAKDNSIQDLTRIDLKEILFLASQEQTKIWFY